MTPLAPAFGPVASPLLASAVRFPAPFAMETKRAEIWSHMTMLPIQGYLCNLLEWGFPLFSACPLHLCFYNSNSAPMGHQGLLSGIAQTGRGERATSLPLELDLKAHKGSCRPHLQAVHLLRPGLRWSREESVCPERTLPG